MAEVDTGPVCTISPNSFISISDQCTRSAAEDKKEESRGALIGEYVRDREGKMTHIKVFDCIEIFPKSDKVEDPQAMLATMIELCQVEANYPKRELLGYYSAGPNVSVKNPKGYDWPISAKRPLPQDSEVRSSSAPQLYLVWNSSEEAATTGNAIKLYKLKNDKVAEEVSYSVDQERDAEMIALTDVLSLECNRTSLTKLQRYREGIDVLQKKCATLLEYLKDVESGSKKPDPRILRSMKSLLSRLPLTGTTGEFQGQLLQDFSRSQLYAYLGAMTNSSVMMAHNSLATAASQRKFGGSYGYSL